MVTTATHDTTTGAASARPMTGSATTGVAVRDWSRSYAGVAFPTGHERPRRRPPSPTS